MRPRRSRVPGIECPWCLWGARIGGLQMDASSWVAIYAAIVGTGALALEVRRWVESGPRLSIAVMPEAALSTDRGKEIKRYLVVTVRNRGNAATTLTHLEIRRMENLNERIRGKPSKQYVVMRPEPPGSPPVLPSVLEPGRQWMGMALPDAEMRDEIASGHMYVAIHGSHSERPTIKKIPVPKAILTDAKEI